MTTSESWSTPLPPKWSEPADMHAIRADFLRWFARAVDELRPGSGSLAEAADYLEAVASGTESTLPAEQPSPRTWELPTVPADVQRLRDALGREWFRLGTPNLWSYEDYQGSWAIETLLAARGPLTEVINDVD